MNNNIELLEIGLSALNFGTVQDMQNALKSIVNNCGAEVGYDACSNMLGQNMSIIPNRGLPSDNRDIEINLKAYCEALWRQIQRQSMCNHVVSYNSMKILYAKSECFKPEYILYSSESMSFKVSDFLDAIKYCLDFVDIVFDIDTEQYSNCITALKGLEKLLNNQENDRKNLLNDLGYALEVFSAVANYFETDKVAKKENKATSMLVSLSIKFLAG
jgi:hypothetical protein